MFTSLKPKNISKVQKQFHTTTAAAEAALALNTVKAAPVGLCPCTGRRASTQGYSRVL